MCREIEIMPDEAGLSSGIRMTQVALSITWKIIVSLAGMTILVGSSQGTGDDWSTPSMSLPQNLTVTSLDNNYRIMTQVPPRKDMVHVDVMSPNLGSKLHVAYDKNSLMYMMTDQLAPLHLGSSRMPGGGQSITLRAPSAHINIKYIANGELGVIVESADGNIRPLSEVWISPEGNVRSNAPHSE